jgi:transcriptional regulator with XRE-family HTH domain
VDHSTRSASRWQSSKRIIREEQAINQEEAAERCGLHRTYYSGIERGVRNLSLVNVEKVAKGLTNLPRYAKAVDPLFSALCVDRWSRGKRITTPIVVN